MKRTRLLDRELLVKTSDLDQGEWSHSDGPLGYISRSRFSLVVDMLSRIERPGRLLEIGYGSGIFMPELSLHADQLVGVDVHEHPEDVRHALSRLGIDAELHTGRAEQLPLEDASVDAVVAVSALEFVDDMEASADEIRRVLRPGGHAIVVTPGQSKLLDTGLKVMTGENPEDTFQGRRGRILPALEARLRQVRSTTFPSRAVPLVPRMYTCAMYQR